jgi:hypothetical protein
MDPPVLALETEFEVTNMVPTPLGLANLDQF